MPELDESILVDRLKAGDQLAFKALYDLYSVRIYGKLLKMVKSGDLAQDILQQTFLNVWDHRATLDPGLSFAAYVFKIADNLTLNTWRKAGRDKAVMEKILRSAVHHYSHTEEWLTGKENMRQIQEAIDRLPPRRKEIFILCKIENKSYAEVSALLGISPSTINDHLVKAVKALKTDLTRQGFFTGWLFLLAVPAIQSL